MSLYYFEADEGYGAFSAQSDEEAANTSKQNNYMVTYRESDTPNGKPFVVVHERDMK